MDVKEIFTKGISGFLSDLINDALGVFDKALGNIVDVALNAEQYMKSSMGLDFDKVYQMAYIYAIYLIVLKFVKKGFNTYVLWDNGDAGMDPFILFTSFCKAIIVAVSFETLYDYIMIIASEIINKILNSFNTADINLTSKALLKAAIAGFLNNGIILVIIAGIYIFLYVKLYIEFIKRGLELFILKKFVPFACTGMLDSDEGVFRPYAKKFLQEILSVLFQVFLLKISLICMINGHFFWGIAAISSSLKTPQFLSEFIMTSQGSGLTTKISQTAHMAQMIRNLAR